MNTLHFDKKKEKLKEQWQKKAEKWYLVINLYVAPSTKLSSLC